MFGKDKTVLLVVLIVKFSIQLCIARHYDGQNVITRLIAKTFARSNLQKKFSLVQPGCIPARYNILTLGRDM